MLKMFVMCNIVRLEAYFSAVFGILSGLGAFFLGSFWIVVTTTLKKNGYIFLGCVLSRVLTLIDLQVY